MEGKKKEKGGEWEEGKKKKGKKRK